jgi:SAM-dependent methyltransferase
MEGGHKKLARRQRAWGKLFSHGLGRAGAIYGAYFPDSSYVFGEHAEFELLFEKFTHGNRKNNGGDIPRLLALMLNVKKVLDEEGVPGGLAEIGVWRGNTAAVLAYYARKHGRQLYLFDTFSGFDSEDLKGVDSGRSQFFADTSVAGVQHLVGELHPEARFVVGRFPQSVTDAVARERFSVVSVDCDLEEPTRAALEFFHERLNPGGMLFLHDYANPNWPGVRAAVEEFIAARGLSVVLLPDKSGTAVLAKARLPVIRP